MNEWTPRDGCSPGIALLGAVEGSWTWIVVLLEDSFTSTFSFKGMKGSDQLPRFHIGLAKLWEGVWSWDRRESDKDRWHGVAPPLAQFLSSCRAPLPGSRSGGYLLWEGIKKPRLWASLCHCLPVQVRSLFNVYLMSAKCPLGTQAVVVPGGWREAFALLEWPSEPHPQATSGWWRDSLICGRKKLSQGYNLQLG